MPLRVTHFLPLRKWLTKRYRRAGGRLEFINAPKNGPRYFRHMCRRARDGGPGHVPPGGQKFDARALKPRRGCRISYSQRAPP
jgi:hypothetical protein